MSRDQLQAHGTILEVLKDGAYRAQLPNGHRCIVRSEKNSPQVPTEGETVLLAFHPYDLSRGRIIG